MTVTSDQVASESHAAVTPAALRVLPGRWTALCGLVASALLLLGWSKPWITFPPGGLKAFSEAVAARVDAPEAASARARLSRTLTRAAARGAGSGEDIAAWADAAAGVSVEPGTPGGSREHAATLQLLRRLLVILRYGAWIVGGAYALFFLRGRGWLPLALGLPLGALALAFGLACLAVSQDFAEIGLAAGQGTLAQLVGGGLLLVVGTLGVTRAIWGRTWIVACVVGAALAGWLWLARARDLVA